MGRGVTLVLLVLVGCRQILGIDDTVVAGDGDGPAATGDGPTGAIDGPPGRIDARTDGVPPPPDATPCPSEYQPVGTGAHLYRQPAGRTGWHSARDMCAADLPPRTHLVIPDDDEEEATVAALTNDAWIGVSDEATEGTWINVVGQPQLFLPWGVGSPDGGLAQNCVRTDVGAGWDDSDCSVQRHVLCECE